MKRGEERRRYFRAAVPANQQQAKLEWGNKLQVSVRIVDESLGGFTAVTMRPVTIEEGTEAKLRMRERDVEVRIVRLRNHGTGSRLGLERCDDYATTGKDRRVGDRRAKRRRWSKRALLSAAVAALALAVTLPWWSRTTSGRALMSIVPFRSPERPWRPELPPLVLATELRKQIREQTGIGVFFLPEVDRLLALNDEQRRKFHELDTRLRALAETGEPVEGDPTRPTMPGAALDLLTAEQHWRLRELLNQSASPIQIVQRMAKQNWPRANPRQLLDRLGGVALTLPRVVHDLKLTEAQQVEIEAIVEGSLDASEELYRQAGGSDADKELAEQATAQLDQSREAALRVLTPAQHKILDSLPR